MADPSKARRSLRVVLGVVGILLLVIVALVGGGFAFLQSGPGKG